LAQDLIQAFESLGWRNIIGVGHSLGGVCTMFAAVQRPDLFLAVVLIEPVILPPRLLWGLRLLQRLGLKNCQPLVRGALRRRIKWPDRQACFQHFRDKSLFANWSDESLWAYVNAGTRPRRDGDVELVYPPEWEAHIFATTPTDVWRYVPQLGVPALVVRGEHSDTFCAESERRMARMLPQAEFIVVPGAGHLIPMECPTETAILIQTFLSRLLV
jgi:pimeloyl-ACP methyl ester carboxylesterase